MVETQFSAAIKFLRSDSGGEYQDQDFQDFLTMNGTLLRSSCPGTPQKNGVSREQTYPKCGKNLIGGFTSHLHHSGWNEPLRLYI